MIVDFSAKHELVNINDKDIKKPIYRVYEVSRLIDIFEKKDLCLVKPKLWDDPYENFLKYAQGVGEFRGKKINFTYNYDQDTIFGQCWTLNKETDATWRIYSPMCDRVKVKTSIEKLFNFMKGFNDELLFTYIGKVKYTKQKNILSQITKEIKEQSPYLSFHFDSLIKKYYLVKRDVFKYENEIRLMVSLPDKRENDINSIYRDPNNLDVCRFPLPDPGNFFDEIVFDPRMENSLVRAFTTYFKSSLKFNKDIYKSKLYDKPYVKMKVNFEFPQ